MKKLLLILINFLCLTSLYSQTNNKIDFKDLDNIQSITKKFNNNLIIALGEGTHGTKDFNDIRIKISKDLIKNHNFTVIAFEHALGDSYYLNTGINSNQNIKDVMRDNLLSIWQTKEFENFFLWIREYNLSHKNKIIVLGFDVNLLNNSAKILKQSKQNLNSDYAKEINILDSLSQKIDNSWLQRNDPNFKIDMQALIKYGTDGYLITKKIDSIYSNNLEPIEKIALTNLQFGFQVFYEASKGNYDIDRDLMMAKNVEKIQKELNSKMILIAHNGHISLQPTLVNGMGRYLKNVYDNNYYSLATITSSGTYSATNEYIVTNNNVLKPYNLPKPYQNSWEEKLSLMSKDDYFIDFRTNSNFPKDSLKMRFLGYIYTDKNNDKFELTEPIVLSDVFDGIIFIHNSKASEPIQ